MCGVPRRASITITAAEAANILGRELKGVVWEVGKKRRYCAINRAWRYERVENTSVDGFVVLLRRLLGPQGPRDLEAQGRRPSGDVGRTHRVVDWGLGKKKEGYMSAIWFVGGCWFVGIIDVRRETIRGLVRLA